MSLKKNIYLILILIITIITAVSVFFKPETAAVNFYVGSRECGKCHNQIYSEWQKTAHANSLINVTDENTLSISETSNLKQKLTSLNYSITDIKYAIGYHWTRRYILFDGKITPFLYSLQNKKFMDYFDKNFKHTNFETECIGCHVTGLKVINRNEQISANFNEPAVGCEACHGPGSLHSKLATKDYILNPASMETNEALMICASCHTNGNDMSGKFKFPLNYRPDRKLQNNLSSHYKNMVPKPGQMNCGRKEFEYKGDNTSGDRLRQLKYWQYIFLQKNGSSCSDCLDFRSNSAVNDMRKNFRQKKAEFFSSDEYCMSCHKLIGQFDITNLKESKEININHKNINYNINLDHAKTGFDITINGASQCIKCHNFNSVHNHMVGISETSELIIFQK